jgi:hypothetical protein
MNIEFWNYDTHKTYEYAKKAGVVSICDAPAYEEEVYEYGFRGGVLCDAMQAIYAVLEAVGHKGKFDAVITRRGEIIAHYRGEDEDE